MVSSVEHRRRLVLTLLLLSRLAVSPSFGKSRLPLKEDVDDDIHQLKPGCMFGGEFYDLEQKFHPVLDSEVMYCTQCTCNPNVVKGQLQQNGSVSCKRMANDCPDVSKCSETPMLPPNSCCKVCPDRGEYYALLTGSFSNDALSDAVAVVHMSLQKTVMHITLDTTRNVEPRTVRVVDEQLRGRVLFEHHVSRDGASARVCSLWLSAFEHLGALRTSRRLSVVLTTRAHPGGELKGAVDKLPMASTAQTPFLGLLAAPSLAGYGGVIWLGVVHSNDRAQIHIHGAVDIAGDSSGSSATLTVELMRDEAPFEKVVVAMHADGTRHKFVHVSQEATRHTLKRLSQGRISVAVQTKTGRRLLSSPKAWHPCGTLQALLSSMDATPQQPEPGSAGLAKVTLLENGSMSYQVHLHKFDRKVAGVVAETTRLSGAASRAIKLPIDGSSNGSLVTGTHEFADARELQLFVEGRVFLAVEVREQPGSALRGQLQLISHGLQATKDNVETVVLNSPKSSLSAVAVCGTTRDCLLFCKTVIPAQASGTNSTADVYIESQKHKNLVATFDSGAIVAASLMSQRDLKELATLRPTIRVFFKGINATAQIALPQSCSGGRLREMENSPIADDSMIGLVVSTAKSGVAIAPELGCLQGGRLYEDGDTWRPATGEYRYPYEGDCSTCSCKRNQIECHREVCPQWSCARPVVRLPGECCPVCNSTSGGGGSLAGGGLSALAVPALAPTRKCYFPGDKRQHTVGTVWHPYIHPFGYFACAVCFCSADGSGYDCKQVICPSLPCPQHVAERRNESDCCKACPARWYQGSSLMPAAAGGTGLVLEPSGGGGGDGGVGAGGSETCASGSGGGVTSTERLHKKPGAAGGLECLQCTCTDNEMNCTKAKCNCRRQPASQSDCCRKLCTLSLHGPTQAAERKLRRLAAAGVPLQNGAA